MSINHEYVDSVGRQRIEQFLEGSGWTVTKLAETIGVSRPAIYNILKGAVPNTQTLARLREIDGLGGLLPEHFPVKDKKNAV